MYVGKETEKEEWLGGRTGYSLISVAHLGGKEKAGRRVNASLAIMDYINYPHLCEVILNGLTVG